MINPLHFHDCIKQHGFLQSLMTSVKCELKVQPPCSQVSIFSKRRDCIYNNILPAIDVVLLLSFFCLLAGARVPNGQDV